MIKSTNFEFKDLTMYLTRSSLKKLLSIFSLILLCFFFYADNANANARNSITVGTSTTMPPFGLMDKKNNKITGYSIDYVNAVAQAAGLQVREIKDYLWKDIFNALYNGEVDLVASSVTVTEARKELMLFTLPYFTNHLTLVVHKNSSINSFADIARKKIGATAGGSIASVGIPRLNPNATVVPFESIGFAAEALRLGEIDGFVADELLALFYAVQSPHYAKYLKIGAVDTAFDQFAIAVRIDDYYLLDKLNEAIEIINQNGTAEKIYNDWFN